MIDQQPSIFEQGMSDVERQVLRAVMGRGRTNPISLREIEAITGLKNRIIRDAVNTLTVQHRMPIGSTSAAPGGYYWCSTSADRVHAARKLIRQMRSEGIRLRALLDVSDLAELDGQERMFADSFFRGQVA